jgi:cytochrome bd-type quinol oxidase subunit 2
MRLLNVKNLPVFASYMVLFMVGMVMAQGTALFDTSASTACQNIKASLTSAKLIGAVGFVLLLGGLWLWWLQQQGAINKMLNAIVGAVVLLASVGIGSWFALAC